ncbi:DNA mismatch repair protein MutT [Lactiplantibacillus plantarum]|nr:DNA mismatch repair protein MutT [Lactiplantibacillus plantarum]
MVAISLTPKAKNQVYTRLVYSAQAFVTRPTVNLDLTEHMAFLWMKPELILTNIRIVPYLKPILTRLV